MKKEFQVGDIVKAVGGMCGENNPHFELTGHPYLTGDEKLEIVCVNYGSSTGQIKVKILENDPFIEMFAKTIGHEGFISSRQVVARKKRK